MAELSSYLLPVVELVGVIVAAVALVSLLVGFIVAAMRAWSARGAFASYRPLLALRILVGYRREGHPLRNRLFPVSAQNFIAMVGTAIGVWALIVVLSVMGGFESDLKGKIVRNSPHVLVEPASPPADDDAAARLRDAVASAPHVVLAEPFVDAEAMVTSSYNMMPGLVVHGVAPGGRLERQWLSRVADASGVAALADPVLLVPDREMGFVARGGAAEPSPAAEGGEEAMPAIPSGPSTAGRVLPAVLLGEELARSLSVEAGDTVTLVVPDGDVGPLGVKPRTRVFRVAGTFVTGMYEYDLKTAYTTDAEARDLFLMSGPNVVAAMVDDISNLDAAASGIGAALAPLGGGDVRTVAQTNRSLFSALRIEKIAMFLVLGLVILVAAFNVFGSLLLVTMERVRDIAIVQSLGATRAGMRGVFLLLGGSIGLVGTFAGLLLGLATCAYIAASGIRLPAEYYLRTLPVEVRWGEIAAVVAAALGAGLLATAYPAGAAARLTPAEGLRND
jgi:lipoprotein-releasing system permease protein